MWASMSSVLRLFYFWSRRHKLTSSVCRYKGASRVDLGACIFFPFFFSAMEKSGFLKLWFMCQGKHKSGNSLWFIWGKNDNWPKRWETLWLKAVVCAFGLCSGSGKHVSTFRSLRSINNTHQAVGCLVGFYDASFYKCGDCLRSLKRRHFILRDE